MLIKIIKPFAMKRKIFYLLALICCMSAISSARQTGRVYNKNTCCTAKTRQPAKMETGKNAGIAGFDLSPLQFFILSI